MTSDDTIKVDLPPDEFRREFKDLVNPNKFELKLDIEWAIEFFGGPVIPFRGRLTGNTFIISRNVPWTRQSSSVIFGTYNEKDGATEVHYGLVRDKPRFYLMRGLGVLSALGFISVNELTSTARILIAILISGFIYCWVHFWDGYFRKKLATSFITELNMMTHNHKSRFKKAR